MNHYEMTIKWVEKFNDLSESQWRTPIAKEKWTIAEVIGHLIPWDEFVVNKRLPYLFYESELPKSPETELINQQASRTSKSCSKEETINNFIVGRENLIFAITNFEDRYWTQEIPIGKRKLTLADYFEGLVKHDLHHFEQIQQILPHIKYSC